MTSRLRWPKILLVIIALVAIFIFTAPASLLKDPVQEANLPIQLSGYQGRLLSGQVKSILIEGVNYSNLSWRLNPMGLLSGKFSGLLTLADKYADLTADVSFEDDSSWQVYELEGRVNLSQAAKASRALQLVKPLGDIVFKNTNAGLENNQFFDSTGTIDWQDAGLSINGQTLSLGLIEGQLSDDGEHLYLDFKGQESIQPSGQIKLTPKGVYEMALTINPDSLSANLSWLRSMGKMDSAGRLGFALKGQL